MRNFFGFKIYDTTIPRIVRVAEASFYGQPIVIYDYDFSSSQAYIKFATEVFSRENELKSA